MASVKIIYIAGSWRSGSTLVADALGSIDGFCHVGELHHVWDRGLTRNWLCGCGQPFRQCPFWSPVAKVVDWETSATSAASLEHDRRALWNELRSVDDIEMLQANYPTYVAETRGLVERAISADDCRFLIDSSKTFRQACVHLAAGNVEFFVVHLVRDSRATVFSLTHRVKQRADDPDGSSMLQPEPEQAVRLWTQSNLQAEALGSLNPPNYLRIRYEDFVDDPRSTLAAVVDLVNSQVPSESLPIEGRRTVKLATTHTISGNPGRIRADNRVEIREDLEWQSAIPVSLANLVTERTADLLRRYGYIN